MSAPAMMTVQMAAAQQVFVLGVLLPADAVKIEQSPLTPERCRLHIYTAKLNDRYEVKRTLMALMPASWNRSEPQPEPFPVDVPASCFVSIPVPLPGIGPLPVLFELTVTEVVLAVAKAL